MDMYSEIPQDCLFNLNPVTLEPPKEKPPPPPTEFSDDESSEPKPQVSWITIRKYSKWMANYKQIARMADNDSYYYKKFIIFKVLSNHVMADSGQRVK